MDNLSKNFLCLGLDAVAYQVPAPVELKNMATVFFVLSGAVPLIIPVFLQQVVGFDGLQTALTMMNFTMGTIILGFVSGSLVQRMQPRSLMQIILQMVVADIGW